MIDLIVTVTIMLALMASILVYALPTIVAAIRRHRQFGPIAAVNILLGWSIFAWVAALAWSLTSDCIDPE